MRHHLSRRLRLRHEVLDESCGEHDGVAIDEQLRLSGKFVDLRLVCECEKLLRCQVAEVELQTNIQETV